MMAVTMPGVATDSQNDESNGADENISADSDRAQAPTMIPTSPLEGEVGAAQQRREGVSHKRQRPGLPPPPALPLKGGGSRRGTTSATSMAGWCWTSPSG